MGRHRDRKDDEWEWDEAEEDSDLEEVTEAQAAINILKQALAHTNTSAGHVELARLNLTEAEELLRLADRQLGHENFDSSALLADQAVEAVVVGLDALGIDYYEEEGSEDEDSWWEEEYEDEELVEARKEIAKAKAAISALVAEIKGPDAEAGDVPYAESCLNEAGGLLEQAYDALKCEEYDVAVELAEQVIEAAAEGLTAFGIDYYEELEGHDEEDGTFDGHNAAIDAPSPEERVAAVMERLLLASSITTDHRVVESIRGVTLQACATKRRGRREVQVTEALVKVYDDNELAFILAHEVAHHENDDLVRQQQAAKESVRRIGEGLDSLNQRMVAKGRGRIRRGIAITGGLLLGFARHGHDMREVSRGYETDADARALELMEEAGYDPDAIEGALRKLHGGSLPNIGYFGTLRSTHPNPSVRGAMALRRRRKK